MSTIINAVLVARNRKIGQLWKDKRQLIFRNLRHPYAPVYKHVGTIKRRMNATSYRRSRGSIASRIPSPSRLKPKTVKKMAKPGNQVSHGASRMNCMPKFSIDPQLAAGGWIPRPRKLRAASARIALPRSQCGNHENRRERIGQQMTPHHTRSGNADAAGRQHIVFVTQREGHAPRDSCIRRPIDCHEGEHHVEQTGAADRNDGDGQDDDRKGQKDVDQPHEDTRPACRPCSRL